ncbi:MAG: PAS domain-containing protein [Gammaproteobacteria bacterium]|nr:PAS domain-containing protein [Gammaproteobacteria bacterium]
MPNKKDKVTEAKVSAGGKGKLTSSVRSKPLSRVKAVAKPKERRTRKRAPYKSPLGLDVQTLEETFKLLEPNGSGLVKQFYKTLFQRHPQIKFLFAGSTQAAQEKKLLAALTLIINNLRNPDVLVSSLRSLGKRHCSYGAVPEHYAVVADTMLDVLKEFTGDMWTEKCHNAWKLALETVSATMLTAYGEENSKETTMSASKKAIETELREEAELTRLRAAIEGSMTAVMMVDLDFNVTFVNDATMTLLRKHQAILAEVFPGFDAEGILGACIDQFHKNPAHQRQLLADKKNLPFQTDITVKTLTFALNVTGQYDHSGQSIGYTLEWSDVTKLREKESYVARLQGTIDGAMTAIMMIDRDFIITYVNNATMALFRLHEASLRMVFPGFNAEKVLGTCIDIFHKNPAHQRQLLSDPGNLPYQTDISVGELQFALNVTAIFDVTGNYVGNALEWSDVTETRAKALAVARLQSAVDGAQANLMLCDNDLNITYANPAVVNMLRKRETELRKQWPSLDVHNLIGQNIDQFHKNPTHQRALLQDPRRLPASAEIEMGDLAFRVNASMIQGPNGEYMGNMVQWDDITEEKDAERQVQSLVDAAVAGDFTQRIDVSNYSGFIRQLGELLNNLVEISDDGLNKVVLVLRALAEGDLTESINYEYKGLFNQLKDDCNMTVDQLRGMVSQILESAGNIMSAAGEIAQGNQDLSQRTEEQASSLEETASSMEQLTSTVKQNADNARQANQLSSSAREQAEKGGDVVGRAVSAMAEINSASKKIADIIGVIDEIAFQTNLLALNAAVEAARAGEQGRGFAVVAGEVRNLAQRSATAAKEIKSLIQDSVEKVDEGSKLVDESGSTLTEIVSGVKKVSDIIAEIAAASQEQSAGIEQVNKAVMQMDEVTQQNAALVEQAAAASESLEDQAKGMSKLMEYFTMDKQGATGSRSASVVTHAAPKAPVRAPRRASKNTDNARRSPPSQDGNDSEWEDF